METTIQKNDEEVKQRIAEALQKCEAMLKAYAIDQPIPEGDDLEYIKGILNAHPRREEKIGPGIKQIVVTRWMNAKKSRHFKIVRIDGTEEYFSYARCIRGGTIDKKSDFLRACRNAVMHDVRKFRLDKVGGARGFTVDHKAPWLFHVIVGAFAETYSIDFEKSPVSGGMIRDNQLLDAFVRFHRERAQYRVLTREEHTRINQFSFNKLNLDQVDY